MHRYERKYMDRVTTVSMSLRVVPTMVSLDEVTLLYDCM